ncbi:hypothetical protein ACLMJK_007574 [Lecanora helva]
MSYSDVVSSHENPQSKECSTIRGYSDSQVPTSRASKEKEQTFYSFNVGLNAGSAGSHNDPTISGRQSGPQSIAPLRVKVRENLKLPCFQKLGISSRVPDPLFTPPDEAPDPLATLPPTSIPRSSSYPQSNMPNTPSPDRSEVRESLTEVPPGSQASATESPSPNQPMVNLSELSISGNVMISQSQNPSEEREDSDLDHPTWAVEAVSVATPSIGLSAGTGVTVLCHSQPCPLPNDLPEEEITTAFHLMMSAIYDKIRSTDRHIDVTHAIPIKFNMGQVPQSPATTPNIHNAVTGPTDYFSPQNNVYSKAVIAPDHPGALDASIPPSPRPVVPPASMSMSLLERYIPPASAEEYDNLFSIDEQSALMDRLIEISPDGGSLIFIYPTAAGATTFANDYLGPLIHPLLRTMCSTHNLSMDFGAGVSKMAAVEKMFSFEEMSRKISILLRKLGRGTSVTRQAPKFTLLASSKQRVDLERKTWSKWWTHQETPRMRAVVDRYLKRGTMLPTRIAGQEVTAATLVQEVLDGVTEGRKYADYDPPRQGIEVGVFVIKRSA